METAGVYLISCVKWSGSTSWNNWGILFHKYPSAAETWGDGGALELICATRKGICSHNSAFGVGWWEAPRGLGCVSILVSICCGHLLVCATSLMFFSNPMFVWFRDWRASGKALRSDTLDCKSIHKCDGPKYLASFVIWDIGSCICSFILMLAQCLLSPYSECRHILAV